MHGSRPGPRGQPSMGEERRGHKQKKRVLAESGTKRERRGMEGVEWHGEKEEGKVDASSGEDMVVHKSLVAD